MKIVCISDTHNKHKQLTIPECDILIHAGDATGQGVESEMKNFAKWFEKQPAKHKVFVPGNHELQFANQFEFGAKEWFTDNCPSGVLLINESITIEGYEIYGTPVTPFFHNWAWNEFAQGLMKTWKEIPESTDILITHGPPYKILDTSYVAKGQHLGCQYLADEVRDRIKPDLHVFGHIHDSHGNTKIAETHYYNVSICDEGYQASNPITIIEL